MKIAVFGHYDSRGGTTAIELPDNPTEADVQAAIKRYDHDVFGIDEPADPINTTAYGMSARVADQMAHSLIYGDESPGVADFLYVAELHGTERIEETAHDEVSGFDLEEMGSVLISGDEGDYLPRTKEIAAWSAKVEAINKTKPDFTTHYNTYLELEPERPADPNIVERIDTYKNPVQLEFVTEQYKYENTTMDGTGTGYSFDSQMTGEEKAAQDARNEAIKQMEDDEEARVAKAATIIKNAKYQRWDDDAFGFILMRKG